MAPQLQNSWRIALNSMGPLPLLILVGLAACRRGGHQSDMLGFDSKVPADTACLEPSPALARAVDTVLAALASADLPRREEPALLRLDTALPPSETPCLSVALAFAIADPTRTTRGEAIALSRVYRRRFDTADPILYAMSLYYSPDRIVLLLRSIRELVSQDDQRFVAAVVDQYLPRVERQESVPGLRDLSWIQVRREYASESLIAERERLAPAE